MTKPLPPNTTSASPGTVLLFATAVGVIVLSLYASQPIIDPIRRSLGLDSSESGLVTTLTLLGYSAGLFLLVPLCDLVENRRLILATLALDVLALLAMALVPDALAFFAACFTAGVAASAIQMLVPLAASLSPEAGRGRVVGNVMSGLMLGILLSRPIASLTAEFVGWHWFYGGLAVAVAILGGILSKRLPRHRIPNHSGYARLIGSLITLLKAEAVLRQRSVYQACCMGAFGVFWTAVALRLAQPPFALNPTGIALFSLAGVAGAVISPFAGSLADRGHTRAATPVAHLAILAATGLAYIGGVILPAYGGMADSAALVLMVVAAVVLDLGVIADQTLGRHAINLLHPASRGRINGLFTGIFFIGAAVGSALSGVAWEFAGWSGVCMAGTLFSALAFTAFCLTELQNRWAEQQPDEVDPT